MIASSIRLRNRVIGSRSPILVRTGRPSGRNERPKSSRTARLSHCQYCTWMGRSSPNSLMSRSFTSGEALGSSGVRKSSGPPGARLMTM